MNREKMECSYAMSMDGAARGISGEWGILVWRMRVMRIVWLFDPGGGKRGREEGREDDVAEGMGEELTGRGIVFRFLSRARTIF